MLGFVTSTQPTPSLRHLRCRLGETKCNPTFIVIRYSLFVICYLLFVTPKMLGFVTSTQPTPSLMLGFVTSTQPTPSLMLGFVTSTQPTPDVGFRYLHPTYV